MQEMGRQYAVHPTGCRLKRWKTRLLAGFTVAGRNDQDSDQIQDDVECVVAYCSRALRPSLRCYCTTEREMLAAVAMCIQFRSYLRGAKFTLRTDHKSLVWLHRFKDTEGMMTTWLHVLQQFQFSTIHQPGRDHGNADGFSRVPSSPCKQCTRPDCPPADEVTESIDQRFDSESTGSSEDTDLIPIHSGENWVALLDDDLSQPTAISGDSFRISARRKTQSASHCSRGFRRANFHHGLQLKV